jgi:hypothetical protein
MRRPYPGGAGSTAPGATVGSGDAADPSVAAAPPPPALLLEMQTSVRPEPITHNPELITLHHKLRV